MKQQKSEGSEGTGDCCAISVMRIAGLTTVILVAKAATKVQPNSCDVNKLRCYWERWRMQRATAALLYARIGTTEVGL